MRQLSSVFLLVLFAGATSPAAQNDFNDVSRNGGESPRLGIQAGLNLSQARVSGPSGTTLAGVGFGVALEVPLWSSVVSLQPELNYMQRGAEIGEFGSLAGRQLNYVELPVQVKFRLNLFGFAPFLMAGPRFAYLVGATLTDSGRPVGRDRLSTTDFGFDFGAGIGLSVLGGKEILLTAKYTLGLLNVNSTGPGDWRNRGLMLLAGLFF